MTASMEQLQRALDKARTQRVSIETIARAGAAAANPFPPHPPLPTLATPQYFPLDTVALRNRRVIFADDQTPAGHSFRMLRAQLRQLARERQLHMIGIVSAADGEGRTLTAINLALGLAADPELSVVLTELDLRRPSIAQILGLQPQHGLETYVEGAAALSEVGCALEGIERLLILAAARPVANSSIALAGQRVQELLRGLRAGPVGQIAIVDLPPALLSDDVLTIAPALDGVLVVGREGYTRRGDLQRLSELLGPGRVLGSILNQSSGDARRGY